jgi:Tfp pilus assembly protein PilZ
MLLTLLDNKERVPVRLPGSRRKVPWKIALGIGVHSVNRIMAFTRNMIEGLLAGMIQGARLAQTL